MDEVDSLQPEPEPEVESETDLLTNSENEILVVVSFQVFFFLHLQKVDAN